MGFCANYTSIIKEDIEAILERIKQVNSVDEYYAIWEKYEDFESLENFGVCENSLYMDKMWAALHFFITGIEVYSVIEGNPISEAIFGTHLFTKEKLEFPDGSAIEKDEDFTSYIYPERVKDIVEAFERVDIEERLSAFDLSVYDEKEIYPYKWEDEDAEDVKAELYQLFLDIKEFYTNTLKKGKGVMVSIA